MENNLKIINYINDIVTRLDAKYLDLLTNGYEIDTSILNEAHDFAKKALKGEISLEVISLLNVITFTDLIADERVLRAIRADRAKLESPVYLKITVTEGDNYDFATPVFEDGINYMVSYDDAGLVRFKEPVTVKYINDKKEIVGVNNRRYI